MLISLLTCNELTVRSRSVGALHNLSSDLQVVNQLRDHGAIPDLIALLKYEYSRHLLNFDRDSNITVVASAAGCLQNISRDDDSRRIIQTCGGVPPLTELLFIEHLHVQSSAAGALLNVSHFSWYVTNKI